MRFVNLSKIYAPVLLALFSCGAQQQIGSEVKFDSAHTVALRGKILEGRIYTAYDWDFMIQSQIEQQLMYTVGQLNGINGGLDLNRTELKVESVRKINEENFEVNYTADLYLAWPLEKPIPKSFDLKLPARADSRGLDEFYARYGNENSERNCLDFNAHEVSQGIFWYYYRPEQNSCELKGEMSGDGLALKIPLWLSKHEDNSEGKSPEYKKIWEDDKLVIVSIFGKYEEEGGADDAGTFAYSGFYRNLISMYGYPIEANVELGRNELPSVEHPELKLVFNTPSGLLEAHLFLVVGIRSVDDGFVEKYNKLTEYADFISYNGHSGLGANIRAMARMGNFVKGQYQLFLVNGCDTFAYVDNALRDAHQEANPDFGPNKFFDLITNAMPSFFHSNASVNSVIVRALVEQKKSYREILAQFDKSQRANVTGEEDNGEDF